MGYTEVELVHFTVKVFFEMLVQFDRVTGGSSLCTELPRFRRQLIIIIIISNELD